MQMTFKVENGMLVTEATQEAESMGIVDGARFVVIKTRAGLALESVEYAEQMAAAREIMEEDRDVLAKLAQ